MIESTPLTPPLAPNHATPARPSRPARALRPRLARDLALIGALAHRDLLRLMKDPGRWLGLVLQPLLLWALMGSGMGQVFSVPGLPEVDYHRFFFPGLLVMVALFTAIFATMAVIEDRDHGFLQQVLVAPASRTAMVLGKVTGVTLIALVQLALVLPAAPLAGFHFGDIAFLPVIAGYTLGVIGMTSLAFALAWVSRTTAGYHAVMGVLLIPLWLVSGSVFPLPHDGALSVVGRIDPITYAVDALRHGLDGGHSALATTGAGLTFALLGAFAVLALVLASFVARRNPGGPA